MAYVPVNYDNTRYQVEPLRRFGREAFEQAGMPSALAEELAGYLVATDLRGVLSHGTRSIPGYVPAFQSRHYNPAPVIKITREAGSVVQLDGDGAIGHLVAARAVRGAVTKARQNGIGMATAVRCGHTGSIGNWTRIGTDSGMISVVYSTAVSLPHYTHQQTVINANGDPPYSVGFPGSPPVVIDMGTLLDKPEYQDRIAEISRLPLIKGVALQTINLMMTMPLTAMQATPAEPYPGAFCSLTTIAIDPGFFGPVASFHDEIERLRQGMHTMEPLPGLSRTVLPGELESEREIDFQTNGVPLDPSHIEALARLADEMGIPKYWE